MISNFDSMYIIGGWVNFSGGGGGFVEIPGEGVVKKRQSPDFRQGSQ